MNPVIPKTVGILSDTHGLLRPEVEAELAGCDRILHAGDVGDVGVLDRLSRIAPVTAVRGNMDYGAWSHVLPVNDMVAIDGVYFYLLHDLYHLDLDPAAADIQLVVSGHTHRSHLYGKDGVTYLNPGSAGHRRGQRPVSVAIVSIDNDQAHPRIIEIDC